MTKTKQTKIEGQIRDFETKTNALTTINNAKTQNKDLVKVVVSENACEKCQSKAGIYSVSGSSNYPKLTQDDIPPYHPNCKCKLVIQEKTDTGKESKSKKTLRSLYGFEFDEDLADTKIKINLNRFYGLSGNFLKLAVQEIAKIANEVPVDEHTNSGKNINKNKETLLHELYVATGERFRTLQRFFRLTGEKDGIPYLKSRAVDNSDRVHRDVVNKIHAVIEKNPDLTNFLKNGTVFISPFNEKDFRYLKVIFPELQHNPEGFFNVDSRVLFLPSSLPEEDIENIVMQQVSHFCQTGKEGENPYVNTLFGCTQSNNNNQTDNETIVNNAKLVHLDIRYHAFEREIASEYSSDGSVRKIKMSELMGKNYHKLKKMIKDMEKYGANNNPRHKNTLSNAKKLLEQFEKQFTEEDKKLKRMNPIQRRIYLENNVIGENPDKREIKAEVKKILAAQGYPKTFSPFVYAMIQKESDWMHFRSKGEIVLGVNDKDKNGNPIPINKRSTDIGLCQINDKAHSGKNYSKLARDWRYNLEYGIKVLKDAYNAAKRFLKNNNIPMTPQNIAIATYAAYNGGLGNVGRSFRLLGNGKYKIVLDPYDKGYLKYFNSYNR